MEYIERFSFKQKTNSSSPDRKARPGDKKSRTAKAETLVDDAILSGIIGGSLVLGVTTYQHSKDETANTSVQTQTNETSNSSASSTKANTEKLSSTNSSDISTMVENVSPAIVGISNYQKQTESGMFGFESNSSSSSEQETGTGSGVIYKKANGKAYIITNNHVVEGASKLTVSRPTAKKWKVNCWAAIR